MDTARDIPTRESISNYSAFEGNKALTEISTELSKRPACFASLRIAWEAIDADCEEAGHE